MAKRALKKIQNPGKDRLKIIKMLKEGLNYTTVAYRLGYDRQALYRYCAKNNISKERIFLTSISG